MESKRVAIFNNFVNELKQKIPASTLEPVKFAKDLTDFNLKYKEEDVLCKSIDFPEITIETFDEFWSYFNNIYACSIKNVKKRKLFLSKLNKTNSNEKDLDDIVKDFSTVITEEEIINTFDADELENPMKIFQLFSDPNNPKIKNFTEKLGPMIQSKIQSGEINPSKMISEMQKMIFNQINN